MLVRGLSTTSALVAVARSRAEIGVPAGDKKRPVLVTGAKAAQQAFDALFKPPASKR